MKHIIFLFFIFFSTIWANFIDISVDQRSNYRFQEQFFLDIDTTEEQEKTVNGTNVDLDININDMGGILYNTMIMSNDDNYQTYGAYFGSDETTYISYIKGQKDIFYEDGAYDRDSEDSFTKLTFLDILSIENHKYSSQSSEIYGYSVDGANYSKKGIVTREYDKEIYKVSTEDLYRKVRLEAIKGDDFFYGIAGAKTIRPWFKVYGLLLASYEYHDISEGRAYGSNDETIIASWGGSDDTTYYENVKGKFKGFGYGYHLTAEFAYKDISFFVTNYYKKLELSNYHTGVKDYEAPADPEEDPVYQLGVIRTKNLTLTQQYTSFGLHYRF